MNDNTNEEEIAPEAEKDEQVEKKPSLGKEIRDYIVMIAVVVAAVLVINQVFLINARIPSASMEDTIMTNDRVFGNRLAYSGDKEPERYDIIIFKFPDDPKQYFIKRVIGLPGETVEIREGKVYINNSVQPLDDSFCPEEPLGNYGPYKVPEGCYFVMGDNRNKSNDSRFWVHTFVTKQAILGKAMFRYWPVDRMGTVG